MNRSNLVGTICYYPNNSDFYFFGFDTFDVKVPTPTFANKTPEVKKIEKGQSDNRDMVFKIICNLCGITSNSTEGTQLQGACENFNGIFINNQKSVDYHGKSVGILYGITNYVKNIRYCLRLDTSRILLAKPNLQFIKFSRKTSALSKNGSNYDDDDSMVSRLPTGSVVEGDDFDNIDICKLVSEPKKLPVDKTQTLLDDGVNVVLLDELTILQPGGDIKNFGTRGKKIRDILINASKLQTVIPEASKEYKQCLTS